MSGYYVKRVEALLKNICFPYFLDIDLDDCNPNPCVHGGTCIDLGYRDYECLCAPEFKGVRCEAGLNTVFDFYFIGVKTTRFYCFMVPFYQKKDAHV